MKIKLVTDLEKQIAKIDKDSLSDNQKALVILYSKGYTLKELSFIFNKSKDTLYGMLRNLRNNKDLYYILH